ncbi:MAG: hypothetical protein M0Z56_04665 [Desulfobacteraceae bacterium]|nr:hypothetical protein [Desulfobacteraceae bacterium]
MSGQPVHKTITVLTSDPIHAKLELTLTGQVKPIAELSASIIRLTGNAGQEISKTITITPASGNPFKIKNVRAEKGTYFRHELVAKKRPGGGVAYDLTVVNLKQEKGFYTDKIRIETDSAISPVLEIRVMGFIREGS